MGNDVATKNLIKMYYVDSHNLRLSCNLATVIMHIHPPRSEHGAEDMWWYPPALWAIKPGKYEHLIMSTLNNWWNTNVAVALQSDTIDAAFLYGCDIKYLKDMKIVCIRDCKINEIKNCEVIDIIDSEIGHMTNSRIINIADSKINTVKGKSKIANVNHSTITLLKGSTRIGMVDDSIIGKLRGTSRVESGRNYSIVCDVGFFAYASINNIFRIIYKNGMERLVEGVDLKGAIDDE